MVAGVLASAALAGLFARGAWALGFLAFVPWLRSLDTTRSFAGALLSGWGMSVAFTAAAFGWFGTAIGSYAQVGTPAGMAVLLLAAPLLQPQFIAFAVVRHAAGRRHGRALRAPAGASAWVAAEWLLPKLLGDTLGYGLYPSALLRQAADVGGTAGLTVLLLLANEGLASAFAHRAGRVRDVAWPLGLAALVPLLLAGYGQAALSRLADRPAPAERPMRVGLVQSNITDYDRLRREKGAEAVLREVLDTHYAMSYDAIERQHADAVLWTETVYPLTFGHPKTEAGAELDQEIVGIVRAAGVPFVFGTYDTDAEGEYNAAAFVDPGVGPLGFYRKTRLFAFTEYVPAWLDGELLREWLPWTGTWRPGTGARVFPLRLRDGREVPVLPMICLDDVDTGLAIDGARLGAQAIVTMSNDAWFTADPLGMAMHQTAAAFRSIETRLPQFRVTSNGHSAAIDRTGTVVAGTKVGERTLVIGDLPVGEPPATLMVRWGDWVGRVAAAFLVLLAAVAAFRAWGPRLDDAPADAPALPATVAVLPPLARAVAGLLRAFARGSLLWMAAAFLVGDGSLPSNTLALIRLFTTLCLVPELAAWLVLRAFAARATLESEMLVLTQGRQRLAFPVTEIAEVTPWRVPVPGAGASLRMASGERLHLVHAHPAALARVLTDARGGASPTAAPLTFTTVRTTTRRGWLDHPLVKFAGLSFLLAVPAFVLHQNINFGDPLGEYHAYGPAAYLTGFALWWASWAIGVVVTAAALRAVTEAGTLLSVAARPRMAIAVRRGLERLGLAVLYLGMPAWLAFRIYGG
ncbi:apolipoprotein N-acyltransferase [Piscinibacter gummiphilus]|uniref:Apolipoprotein N-acyltransferase n=1 Tax=Piscinibacter gummiphilus TaxID=946333 RepID=A0A1W6LHK2_9BURK|nr:apolipoprotein N-acyltransferase [Piscinibacter gummiphilus]ATU68445.1 apolipoprotein N-acyltransferase [Piscinibacter gummiphilus]